MNFIKTFGLDSILIMISFIKSKWNNTKESIGENCKLMTLIFKLAQYSNYHFPELSTLILRKMILSFKSMTPLGKTIMMMCFVKSDSMFLIKVKMKIQSPELLKYMQMSSNMQKLLNLLETQLFKSQMSQ